MKKILLVLNETHIPQHVIQKAIEIAKESGSFLEAVFLNDISALNFGYPFPNDLSLASEQLFLENQSEETITLMKAEAQAFKDKCQGFNISCKIEIDQTISIPHLIELSTFADLIIADSRADSDEYDFKDILSDAHCPVLLVPWDTEPIEKIFLAYDGSNSSMYAIKMFSYLFPEFKNLPVQFFHIATGTISEIPHINAVRDWISKHFSNVTYELLSGNIRKGLVEFIKSDSGKVIIVMGAYSRSSVSRLFAKSMIEPVINETNASLFLTH